MITPFKQNCPIKVGDLVRYNAAGQRNKSIGLVLKLRNSGYAALIQWVKCPEYRPMLYPLNFHDYRDTEAYSIRFRQLHKTPTWYYGGDWWEVIQ